MYELPRLDVSDASNRNLRPLVTAAGSGLCIVTWACSVNDRVWTTDTPLSPRVVTKARWRAGSMPLVSVAWLLADGVKVSPA
jgi:hypothetical protein